MITNPPTISFKGNSAGSQALKARAVQQYNHLVEQAEVGGLSFLSRKLVLPDGSTFNMTTNKTSIYGHRVGKVIITSSAGGQEDFQTVVFAFVTPSGEYVHINDGNLNISNIESAIIPAHLLKNHYAYYNHTTPTNYGAISMKHTGELVSVDEDNAYSFCYSRYYPADESKYALHFDIGTLRTLTSNPGYKVGVSILHKGVQYATGLQASYSLNNTTPILGGFSLSITSVGDSIYMGMCGVKNPTDRSFTGRYTDGTYYEEGLVPYLFREQGNNNDSFTLFKLELTEVNISNDVRGMVSYKEFRSFGFDASFNAIFTYASISKGVPNHVDSSGSIGNSYLVSTLVYHNVTLRLFDRAISVLKWNVDKNGDIDPTFSVLDTIQLTEQNTSHYPSYTGIALNNRDSASILGGFSHQQSIKGSVEKSTLGYFKKVSTYIDSPLFSGTIPSLGTRTNTLKEDIFVVKINMITKAKTEVKLLSTRIDEIHIQNSNETLPSGNNENWTRHSASGSTHILELYYADYEHDVYVIGELVMNMVGLSFGSGSTGWPTGIKPINSVDYNVVSYISGVRKVLLTKQVDMSGYNTTTQVSAPIPLSHSFTQWSLWESLRYLAMDTTGLSDATHPFQIKRVHDNRTVGVFTAKYKAGKLNTTFIVLTESGVTKIRKLWDESVSQFPFQTTI